MIPFADTTMMPLIYAGVFLGVLMAYEGLRQVLSRSESVSETRNRRMKLIASGASTEEILRLLKPSTDGWSLAKFPFIGGLPTDLRQAGLTVSAKMFLLACLFATVAVTAAASPFVIISIALPFAAVICLIMPIVFVRIKRRNRVGALEQQLPDALDLMARGLKVGHPLNTTIAAVGNDMNDPIASEFGMISDQIAFGDDLVDAFMDFAERIDVEDVRYLAISVAIQNGTGGDLSQVLRTLAQVIRDRFTMRKRIQAISSEGRLTSIFLSGLPFFIFGATMVTSPTYYIDVSGDPLFMPFAIVVGVLVLTNFLAMRRLVDFRI
ncbi:MAG: type II secretion system F family protein [Marinosulfonomonas sp.]|nr:type II secretion system F family protein [Marinosulfonomonas sp.]